MKGRIARLERALARQGRRAPAEEQGAALVQRLFEDPESRGLAWRYYERVFLEPPAEVGEPPPWFCPGDPERKARWVLERDPVAQELARALERHIARLQQG